MSSIITKRGDNGTTDRLFGGKARKSSLLVEAIGNLDELNAWIGFASDATDDGWQGTAHTDIQKDLISIMGELSAGYKWFEEYQKKFGAVSQERISKLEETVHVLESGRKFTDWANPTSHWDIACRVCRRAERSLWQYQDSEPVNPVRHEVLIYINRLSDLLWIWARK